MRFEQNFSAIKLDFIQGRAGLFWPRLSDGKWALLTVMMSDVPVFYDCEASCIGGLRIEIGWAFIDTSTGEIQSESHLLKPPLHWDMLSVWDPECGEVARNFFGAAPRARASAVRGRSADERGSNGWRTLLRCPSR